MRIRVVLSMVFLTSFELSAAEVVDVASRGEVVRVLVEAGDDPSVVVLLLFAGGKGVLRISSSGQIGKLGGNFLVRSRGAFQRHGAITAVIDAPSDRKSTLVGFRGGADHAKDVGAVIKEMRARTGLAVWLVGTSRGTNSVANAAIRLETDRPDGIVLTATMLRRNKGDQVLAMDLDAIEMPVLIAHHGKDACRVTPPNKVEHLRKALKNARPVKVLIYRDGSGIKGKPCQAFHYHGFRGIESQVVADIMNWIKAPAP